VNSTAGRAHAEIISRIGDVNASTDASARLDGRGRRVLETGGGSEGREFDTL